MVQMKAPVVAAPPTDDQKCIWLASYPKSGNTWVRVFLHNLLNIKNDPAAVPQNINRLSEHTAWELLPSDYDKLLSKPALEATPIQIAQARHTVQLRLAKSKAKPFLVKTHNAIANVAGFPTINLDVTLAAIYVVRNPLDVAISYAHHSNLTIDHTIACMSDPKLATAMSKRNVYEFLGSWSFNVASWLSVPNRPVYLLRYEDLVVDPLRTFSGLVKFLRIDATVDQIKLAVKHSEFGELAKQEQESGFVERPEGARVFFRNGKPDEWRSILTKSQFEAVVSAHAPMMQRIGYLPADCGANFS